MRKISSPRCALKTFRRKPPSRDWHPDPLGWLSTNSISGEPITMRWASFAGKFGVLLLVAVASLTLSPAAPGQDTDQDKARPAPKVAGPAGAEETVQAIDDEYDRQLLHLEKRRVEQLAQLAA